MSRFNLFGGGRHDDLMHEAREAQERELDGVPTREMFHIEWDDSAGQGELTPLGTFYGHSNGVEVRYGPSTDDAAMLTDLLGIK